jgi:hypothetical protein
MRYRWYEECIRRARAADSRLWLHSGEALLRMFFGRFTIAAIVLALSAPVNPALAQGRRPGSGLVLDSLTGVSLPLLGELGDIVIDQAVITDLRLVEDLAGQIIGLEVTGTLNGTLSATGVDVVNEQFTSTLAVTSSGPGQCEVVGVQLGPLALDALGLVAIDVPEADLTGRGSGAVGSLLCNLGSLLNGPLGVVTRGVQGLVNALNRLI